MKKKIHWEDKCFILITLVLAIPMGFNPIFSQMYLITLALYVLKKTFLNLENVKKWRVLGLSTSIFLIIVALINILRISKGVYW
ncbi:hypothetical protein CN689_12485 [Peribacillus butanolivorans]|uniref:DUF4181 domain-containing protein n=1 Tax=Peribacillus butanolivorans TaxID=421767 RepID=A0AAX0S3J6_9BACI|nr:hypothetical protein [Peribacillus butanolivorans]PEJ33158.1 hypothetical protein CN689_12485 [Peribacillus butanolivorans]